MIQPNINNLNTNLLKINRNEINRTEIPNRNVYNNHFSPINLNYNNIPQPITFLKPKLPNNTNLTVTIENIDKTNMNRTYINKLLTDLNINKNTVALVSFGNTSCFITFTTYTAKYYFTNLNFKLKNTPYNKLFIYNLLTPIQIRQKNIYYHAVKSGKLDGYKCVLNLENDTYELRLRRTNNTTDWKNKPLIPTDTQKIEWQNSLNSFKFDQTKNTNKTT